MAKISVTLPTLESRNHIVGDIERGVKIYKNDGVEFEEREPLYYWARVLHKGNNTKTVSLTFTRDGQDIKQHYCDCIQNNGENPPVCRHVVAAVLAISGGIVETNIYLGMSASVNTIVTYQNTAQAVGSGSLEVFATPMMIALMERAACEVLFDSLDERQTSVGTNINVKHTSPSAIGFKITATATITAIRARTITFEVIAQDETGEIGRGEHTRVIVDKQRFTAKLQSNTISTLPQ